MPLSLVRLREIRKGDSLNDQLSAGQILSVESTASTQDDLQDGILSQLKRIIWGNDVGNWNDDFMAQYVSTLKELSNGRLFFANCLTSDTEGQLVRIASADILGVANVTKVSPEYVSTMPTIGMLVEKISTTTCIVQTSGYVKVIALPALVAGKRYFVGLNSLPSQYPADLGSSLTGIAIVQVIGVARDLNVLELNISLDMHKQKV
jgi:hypothetical protein